MVQIIVKNRLKEVFVGDESYNIGSDFADALNDKVKELVKEAGVRATNNGRKTIGKKDL